MPEDTPKEPQSSSETPQSSEGNISEELAQQTGYNESMRISNKKIALIATVVALVLTTVIVAVLVLAEGNRSLNQPPTNNLNTTDEGVSNINESTYSNSSLNDRSKTESTESTTSSQNLD